MIYYKKLIRRNVSMKENTIISPIFYMGNKKKLIQKGLINLFPKNIDTFYDIFGGSGVVSLNVSANKIVLNDKNAHLYQLYRMFQQYSSEDIISHIKHNVEKYGLAKERTKRNQYDDIDKLEKYKEAYTSLRKEYNTTKYILDLYTLMFYSFSQQIRFNRKGEFNMPIGNDYFSEKNEEYIREAYDKMSTMRFMNCDFKLIKDYVNHMFSSNSFVYLDPPYFNTTATYNENEGWTYEDEMELLSFCELLHQRGIKFGMSNVFECKGKKNQHLIDWCEKHNFNVYTFDKSTYCACGKGNSNAKEVYICNY